VRAVVAYAPSTLVYDWGRDGARIRSSWTRGGKGLPCAYFDASRVAFGAPPYTLRPGYAAALEDPATLERAAIPIEQTRGAILMISGEADAMWPASEYAELGMRRLVRHGFAYPFEHLRYPDAGHLIGQPNLPAQPMPGQLYVYGGDPRATAHASRDSWPRVLAFLERALGS
jgi:dienelactone hydrolase